jgi:hypothetical protein
MFVTAAFNPAIGEALGNPAIVRNLANRLGVGWSLTNGIMNASTIVTTLGTALLAVSASRKTMVGFVAAACAAAASFAWLTLSAFLFAPPAAPSVSAIPPNIALYSLLLSGTVTLLGWTIFRAGPRRLGIFLTVAGSGALIAAAAGALPVLVAHLPLLILGGTLELGAPAGNRGHRTSDIDTVL